MTQSLNTALNQILTKTLAESERKSWLKETTVWYAIYIRRGAEWFSGHWRRCEDNYPHGMSREQAKAIAGKGGRLYRVTITRERIQ
jgi:hypothetical protein